MRVHITNVSKSECFQGIRRV